MLRKLEFRAGTRQEISRGENMHERDAMATSEKKRALTMIMNAYGTFFLFHGCRVKGTRLAYIFSGRYGRQIFSAEVHLLSVYPLFFVSICPSFLCHCPNCSLKPGQHCRGGLLCCLASPEWLSEDCSNLPAVVVVSHIT